MKTKHMKIDRIKWMAAVLFGATLAGPAVADGVNDDIREQGKTAITAMRADIQPSLPGFEVPARKPEPMSVEESIRVGGRVAMRSMERDLDLTHRASPVGSPEVLDRKGLVTVSAYTPAEAATRSESL